MEEQYRLRDGLAKPIDEITRATARYLKGKYAKNPKKLGDWKFKVDDNPAGEAAAGSESPVGRHAHALLCAPGKQ